jgi:hypothetical protein
MVVVSAISYVAVSFLPETRGIVLTPDAADTAAETAPVPPRSQPEL